MLRPFTVMGFAADQSETMIPSDLVDESGQPVGQSKGFLGNTLDCSTSALAPAMMQPLPSTLAAFCSSNSQGRFQPELGLDVPSNASAIEGSSSELVPPVSGILKKSLTSYVRDSAFVYHAPIMEVWLYEDAADADDLTCAPSLVVPFLSRLEFGAHSRIAATVETMAFHKADDRNWKTPGMTGPLVTSKAHDPAALQYITERQPANKLAITSVDLNFVADAGPFKQRMDVKSLQAFSVSVSSQPVLYPGGLNPFSSTSQSNSSSSTATKLPPIATPSREFRVGGADSFCVRVLTASRAVLAEQISSSSGVGVNGAAGGGAVVSLIDSGGSNWFSYRTDEVFIRASPADGESAGQAGQYAVSKRSLPVVMVDGVVLKGDFEALKVMMCRPGGKGREVLTLPVSTFTPITPWSK
eukprot:GDKJ01035875.1.p1 GENE.GDKJ01035875.1~~GDKJ01035875.1.p1  ORF type:complete len:413 (+),score=94.12 GDKJ01035875.1:3-1241(+)